MKDNVLLSVYRDSLIISQIQFFLFLVDRAKAVSYFFYLQLGSFNWKETLSSSLSSAFIFWKRDGKVDEKKVGGEERKNHKQFLQNRI